jgi:hypothetical protein
MRLQFGMILEEIVAAVSALEDLWETYSDRPRSDTDTKAITHEVNRIQANAERLRALIEGWIGPEEVADGLVF